MHRDLFNQLELHIQNELREGYEVEDVNSNDLDAIIWNIHDDIKERISEYVETIEK